MSNVIVRLPSRDAWSHRQQRPCAIQGLHLTLSSRQSTSHGRADSDTADDVAHFLDNWGLAESLNVSRRCDCKPNVRQMREIVALDSPATSAMLRVVHCVVCEGGPSSVRVITSTTTSSVTFQQLPAAVRRPGPPSGGLGSVRATCPRCFPRRAVGAPPLDWSGRLRTPTPPEREWPRVGHSSGGAPIVPRSALINGQRQRSSGVLFACGRVPGHSKVQAFSADTTLGSCANTPIVT